MTTEQAQQIISNLYAIKITGWCAVLLLGVATGAVLATARSGRS